MGRGMIRDRQYLKWLRDQPCLITGWRAQEHLAIDPAHIGTSGTGIKSPDNHAIPLRHDLHEISHRIGFGNLLKQYAPDWLLRAMAKAYAEKMYQEYKNDQ